MLLQKERASTNDKKSKTMREGNRVGPLKAGGVAPKNRHAPQRERTQKRKGMTRGKQRVGKTGESRGGGIIRK